MSLWYHYTSFSTSNRIWSLYGRTERPRAVIDVSVIGPAGTAVENGLLDTGADDTAFPDYVATTIGIDLSNAPSGAASGVGQVGATLRYAEVLLRITDGIEFREWPARVGFTFVPLHRPLLGFAGFLQFFTATFHGDTEQVELTVNGAYPGN